MIFHCYKYDPSGRRIERSVQNHLAPTKSYSRKFIYDGDHIIAILDGEDKFIAGYMFDEGIDEPVVLVTDYNGDKELDVLSLVRDRQNSVKLIVNEKKEIIQEISYTAYGETKILNRGQKNPVTNNIFYYTSRELEPELGIYYYRARYYDPGTGRFLSEDPISHFSGDPNLYRYLQNRPVNTRDPFGLYMERGGGQEVSGDAGTQMIIDSYVRQSEGDYTKAWEVIVAERSLGFYAGSDTVASAEHYLYARSEVKCKNVSPEMMAIMVSGYQLLKTVTPQETNQTPPSFSQLRWGYQGIWDGM